MHDVLDENSVNFRALCGPAEKPFATLTLLLWTNPHPKLCVSSSGSTSFRILYLLLRLGTHANSIIVAVGRHSAVGPFPSKFCLLSCNEHPNSVHGHQSFASSIRVQHWLWWVNTRPKSEFVAVGLCPWKFTVSRRGPISMQFLYSVVGVSTNLKLLSKWTNNH